MHWLSHQRPCLFFVCPPSANSPIIIRCSSSSASASIHFIHPLHPSIHSNQPQAAIRSTPTNQPSASNPPATWCAKERASEWATRVTRNGTVTTVLAYHLPLPPSYIPKPHASTIPVSYTHIHHPILESIKQLHSIITNVKHHKPSSINQQPSFVQHSPINYQLSTIIHQHSIHPQPGVQKRCATNTIVSCAKDTFTHVYLPFLLSLQAIPTPHTAIPVSIPSFFNHQSTRSLCQRDGQQIQLLVGEIYVHVYLSSIAPSYTQATHQHYPRINTQISIIQH